MAERAWTSRGYRADDAPGILGLRRAVFGEVDALRLTPEVWRWQFLDNPAGPGFVRLADHDEAIVGQYAAIPTRFRLPSGEEKIFAMSCDTMTHPQYQKQGMFVRLAQELYAEIEEKGIVTVWGFPNDASRPGFVRKLGWFDVHVFPTLVKPLRSHHVLQRYVRSRALARLLGGAADGLYRLVAGGPSEVRSCTIRELTRFDERFETLWNRHRSLAPVIQVRSRAYLQWRYLGAPAFDYRPFEVLIDGILEGYFVLRVLSLFDMPFGALVDIFPCPILDARVTREVLSFAQAFVAERGAAFMTALLPPAHADHLTRFGFFKVPDFLSMRRWYLGCRCPPSDRPLLGDVRQWYITYGDADIV
jgi:GNAT superfamily N-acetyltransferase